jgi:hypothetical protein
MFIRRITPFIAAATLVLSAGYFGAKIVDTVEYDRHIQQIESEYCNG